MKTIFLPALKSYGWWVGGGGGGGGWWTEILASALVL